MEPPHADPVPWPCNAWYVAATSDELGSTPLGRQICGERMVFFRRLSCGALLPDHRTLRFIWVWPGDAEAADPAALHHVDWAESDAWAYGGGMFHIKCD